MATIIRVASVGPSLCVKGGISRVIELISAHLPAHICLRLIATFTRYTGDKGATRSDRGSRVVQVMVYVVAIVQTLGLALGRRTVFHVHFSGRGSLLRKGMICVVLRALRCQYVAHSHAADTNLFSAWVPRPWQQLLLWGIGGAGQVIVLTQFWYDYYRSLLHLPPNRVLLLPNPADLPKFVPDRSRRKQLRILFLGRIGVRKGAFDLIRAFAGLPEDLRSVCHLTMAGDGDTEEVRALADELGCVDRVSIPGWIGKAEVERLLVESDVLVLPSYAEGMAMALVEAMSWALPVVTTVVGGAGEFLEQGSNCLLVTPGDVCGITTAISELARDPAYRVQLGRAARQTISRFSIDSYVLTLTGVYEDLAGRLATQNSVIVPSPRPHHEDLAPTVSRVSDHADSTVS